MRLIEELNRSGGMFTEDANWMDWANFFIGIVFILLCAWLLWLYFDKKYEWDQARPEFDKKSSGSFKGFWARYRGAVVLFLSVVFLLLGITFIAMGIIGFEPTNDIVGYSLHSL